MYKLLIIDTFGLIFRAYHAYPYLSTSQGKSTNAVFGFLQMLLNSIQKFEPDYIFCAGESEIPTFRHISYPEYKANRKEADNELKEQIPYIFEILDSLGIKILKRNNYEADDIIGSFINLYKDKFSRIQVITGDRDILQLISLGKNISIFIPGKKFSDLIEYDSNKFKERFEIDVENYVFYKALTGDASDNIKGIPGIGPKTASKIVNKFQNLKSLLVNLDQLPPNLAENISLHKDLLIKYYELSQIKLDIDINICIEDLRTNKLNTKNLRKIIQEYEFFSLSKKIANFIDFFEKKYLNFNLFQENNKQLNEINEISYVYIDHIQIKDNRLFILNTNHNKLLIGDGEYFTEIDEKEFIKTLIIKKINQIIGFNLKSLIKKILNLDFNLGYKLEYIDLKLCWYLIDNNLYFENINDIASFTKINSYNILYEKTLEKIKESELKNVFYLEKKLQIVLSIVENEGIYCDINYLNSKEKEYSNKIHEIKTKMFKLIGHEFNPSSTKDLSYILFDVLKLPIIKKKKKNYSTDEYTLSKLEGLHEIIPLIKEYRSYSKTLSTYVLGIQKYLSKDRKIHTTFIQDNVKTGRLSSINPNLQNLPTIEPFASDIRKAFYVKDGFLVSLDYSQIDLRILAFESKDINLIKAFKNNEDIHLSTAKIIFNKDNITSLERDFAKKINFGIIYGMEAYGLSEALGISQEEAKNFIITYFEKFSGVKKYFDRIKQELDKYGYVKTFLGRKRYFHRWNTANKQEKKAIFREAINMPIQGGSSDIIKTAMIKIQDLIIAENIKAKILLQIHDELIIWIWDKNNLEKIISSFKNIMENIYNIDVPLVVNHKISKNLLFSK